MESPLFLPETGTGCNFGYFKKDVEKIQKCMLSLYSNLIGGLSYNYAE